MGLCFSSWPSAVADFPPPSPYTAKVILPDGALLEYAGPARASDVLLKESPGASFLCCADDMNIDGRLPPVHPDEELEPGQIYFVLPASMLRGHLRAEEMAELAARASGTLARSGAMVILADCRKKGEKAVARVRDGRGRPRNFLPNLGTIAE